LGYWRTGGKTEVGNNIYASMKKYFIILFAGFGIFLLPHLSHASTFYYTNDGSENSSYQTSTDGPTNAVYYFYCPTTTLNGSPTGANTLWETGLPPQYARENSVSGDIMDISATSTSGWYTFTITDNASPGSYWKNIGIQNTSGSNTDNLICSTEGVASTLELTTTAPSGGGGGGGSSTAMIAPMYETTSTASTSAAVFPEVVALPLFIWENYEAQIVWTAIIIGLVTGLFGGLKLMGLL
jgi:hypothetical protein